MAFIKLIVNETEYSVDVDVTSNLLEVLRDKLYITSPKAGCETGDCGACSVLIDGQVKRACITSVMSVEGANITTIEGLGIHGELHPLQKHFYEQNAFQCGFCTPGMILTAKALLDENPNPTEDEVKSALAGNICRCTGYLPIIKAVLLAAEEIRNTRNRDERG